MRADSPSGHQAAHKADAKPAAATPPVRSDHDAAAHASSKAAGKRSGWESASPEADDAGPSVGEELKAKRAQHSARAPAKRHEVAPVDRRVLEAKALALMKSKAHTIGIDAVSPFVSA